MGLRLSIRSLRWVAFYAVILAISVSCYGSRGDRSLDMIPNGSPPKSFRATTEATLRVDGEHPMTYRLKTTYEYQAPNNVRWSSGRAGGILTDVILIDDSAWRRDYGVWQAADLGEMRGIFLEGYAPPSVADLALSVNKVRKGPKVQGEETRILVLESVDLQERTAWALFSGLADEISSGRQGNTRAYAGASLTSTFVVGLDSGYIHEATYDIKGPFFEGHVQTVYSDHDRTLTILPPPR